MKHHTAVVYERRTAVSLTIEEAHTILARHAAEAHDYEIDKPHVSYVVNIIQTGHSAARVEITLIEDYAKRDKGKVLTV